MRQSNQTPTEKSLSQSDLESIFLISCPLFVPLVEEGLTKGPITKLIVESYLNHFKNTDIDTLILGVLITQY